MIVSAVESHTVFALDSSSGDILWRFTAGGRVDSSPTLYKGLVLFGCTDGWAYCLRLTDGALVWRYLVAPDERQLMAFQQLESVWPVHGSLLVHNDTVYCLAGRNMFFDGGLRLALLDPVSGHERAAHRLDENDPDTGKNLQTLIEKKYMPVANADLFSCNGKHLFMQTQKFDLNGKRLNIAPILPGNETPDMAGDNHLFCQTGFLDDSWFHRSYWIYGNNCGEGWGDYFKPRYTRPAGRLMVFDETMAYAFRSEILHNRLNPRQTYTLYATDKDPVKKKRVRAQQPGFPPSHWQTVSPELMVNAMALGGDVLIVAGPPDLADETRMMDFLPGAHEAVNRQIRAQEAAWQGKRGGLLWAVNAKTGKKISEARLDTYPVFDGLIVAEGRLYMSMLDGTVRCYR